MNTSRIGPDKVAVVVIHGMGEQRPMETLRGFVETLWEKDSTLFEGLEEPNGRENSDTWSKPDRISGSAELRRITTARARTPGEPGVKGIRADFFELHWADVTADSTWADFADWFTRLLRRNPFGCEVPTRLLLVWLLLWLTTIAVAVSGLSTALSKLTVLEDTALLAFLGWKGWAWTTAALLVFGALVKGFLTSYFGDVARYVSATPRNIKVRQTARERGLKLLRELHATGEYLRIVVVGHSLGSVLAHDLVALAWADAAGQIRLDDDSEAHAAIAACEKAGLALLKALDESPTAATALTRHDRGCACEPKRSAPAADFVRQLGAYRESQRRLFGVLSKLKVGLPGKESPAWLISDLVTLGCPLAHASFLIARNGCELQVMTRSREILRSPPVYELGPDDRPVFTFRPSKNRAVTQLHHACALAPVRWTNLHDTTGPLLFLRGDLISGPVSRDYGPGATDIPVQPRRGGFLGALFPRLFTHTLYWSCPRHGGAVPPEHVGALRDAVNLLDDPQVEARLIGRLRSRATL